jgi:hypothetical protein
MRAPIDVHGFLGLLTCLCCAAPAHAQSAAKPPAQCLYSGPLADAVLHTPDPPVRLELDADGRGVKLIHKAQTNYDLNNPFKAPVMGERATCRLKLDCAAPREGLQGVAINVVNSGAPGDTNVWINVGSTVTIKYSDAARNLSCRVKGVELL